MPTAFRRAGHGCPALRFLLHHDLVAGGAEELLPGGVHLGGLVLGQLGLVGGVIVRELPQDQQRHIVAADKQTGLLHHGQIHAVHLAVIQHLVVAGLQRRGGILGVAVLHLQHHGGAGVQGAVLAALGGPTVDLAQIQTVVVGHAVLILGQVAAVAVAQLFLQGVQHLLGRHVGGGRGIVLVVVLLAAAGGQGQHHHQRQQQRGHFFRHVHGSKPAFQFVYALLDGGGERKIPGFPKNFSLFKRREMCYTILEQKSEGGTDVADRVILHCDLNCFFASVELLSYPALRNVPVAVCGDPESRHGIVLAKNEAAKRLGVKTAETIWLAKRKAPNLITLPPHHGLYQEYSRKVNAIYGQYTDLVEPFGIDESWLDITGSMHLFGGDGKAIADQLRDRLRQELGLTISVGVSFNKIFAKLGSDYKKPDATTVISRDNWQEVSQDFVDTYDMENDITARCQVSPRWLESADRDTKLEKIITQKWIAMFPEGCEAWAEQRRTGYPRLFPVRFNHSKDGCIDTETMIRRLNFPGGLKTENAEQYAALVEALGGDDNAGSRLWWDTGINW